MLVQNLSITYKCFSSIGTSLKLEEMMYQVLRTFVSETYASYALFTLSENKKEKEITSFGKIDRFDSDKYANNHNINHINHIKEVDRIIIIIKLEHGHIYLVTKRIDVECSFYISMFESFINKLNSSIESCINVKRIHESNSLLKKQKKELILANKAKDDFLANMSHELKTPLNSINIISSVMKNNTAENLSEKQIKNLEIINKSGNQLLFLVNDALDLSKLESGELSLTYTNINIHTFIKNIYEMILPQTEEKNLKFTLNIDKSLDFIYSDENRINQILKNLLSNSLKFTETGEIKLTVINNEQTVKIIVEDEGIGIPDEKLVNIFERFKQVDESTSRKYGGTGLGLAICKELSLLLKGDISVQSIINKGTKFELIIPKSNETNINFKKSEKQEINEYNLVQETSNSNEKKEKIIIFNNQPIFFFNIIIELSKRYVVEQETDFNDFLNLNNTGNIKKAIIDLSNLTEDQINKISEENGKNFIFIYENEEEVEKLSGKSLFTINKKSIRNDLNKI